MKLICCLGLVLVTTLSASEPARSLPIEKYKMNSWEDDIGYRQAVRVGNTLHISGVAGSATMSEAIDGVYGELAKTLAHFGLTFADVVKENAYTTDIDALKANQPARFKFYGKDFPAATWGSGHSALSG